MKFILTIDTEGDNQWDHGRELTVENIKYVDRFQTLCEKYKIRPTYLITSEVAEDRYAKELFSSYVKNNVAEIGAHLHSWSTPPFLDQEGYRENDSYHAFASELPFDLINLKLQNLTNQITECCGRRPTSFRSGRYGFNELVAEALILNRYLVDSSVTPFVSWVSHKGLPGASGGPDFTNYTPHPFTYDLKEGSLLEIPISIAPTRFPFNKHWGLARKYFKYADYNMVCRMIRRLLFDFQPVWARPIPGTTIGLLKELVFEMKNKKVPYLTMMFHSSELMPGCSKYRPDQASIEKLYQLLEDFFELLKQNQIDSVTLSDTVQIISE